MLFQIVALVFAGKVNPEAAGARCFGWLVTTLVGAILLETKFVF
jgi:hypothetical protein